MRKVLEGLALIAVGALIGAILVGCLVVGQHRQLNAIKSEDVRTAQAKAGPSFTCWAEDNDEMPEGYEVLCNH